jgi:hypothetical protein
LENGTKEEMERGGIGGKRGRYRRKRGGIGGGAQEEREYRRKGDIRRRGDHIQIAVQTATNFIRQLCEK